jgi:hypothetical protein
MLVDRFRSRSEGICYIYQRPFARPTAVPWLEAKSGPAASGRERDNVFTVDSPLLQVLTTSFQQRRKMLRQSLKNLLASRDMTLPEEWATRRPEELSPPEFVELTRWA